MTANGNFEVAFSPQNDELNVGRMIIHKTYSGDLEGIGQGQMLSKRTLVEGSAAYVAIEEFKGTLDGKQGSFTLVHTGNRSGGVDSLTISVIPDSGTGALTGLQGTLQIQQTGEAHLYSFEYALPTH